MLKSVYISKLSVRRAKLSKENTKAKKAESFSAKELKQKRVFFLQNCIRFCRFEETYQASACGVGFFGIYLEKFVFKYA